MRCIAREAQLRLQPLATLYAHWMTINYREAHGLFANALYDTLKARNWVK